MAGSSPRKSAKDLIKGARLPERSVEICLHPDLVAQMQEAERRLQEAQQANSASGSLAGSGERAIAEEIEALRQQMVEHTLVLRLRALQRREFTTMQAKHPPRKDNQIDAISGVNVEDMTDELVHRCVVAPELDAEDWAALDESISDGQWQQLANAAWAINARDVSVPFSRTASRILQTSSDE